MNNTTLQRKIKTYLKRPGSILLRRLARSLGISPTYLLLYLQEKRDIMYSLEQINKLMDIIAQGDRDPVYIAGKFRRYLINKGLDKYQIELVADMIRLESTQKEHSQSAI